MNTLQMESHFDNKRVRFWHMYIYIRVGWWPDWHLYFSRDTGTLKLQDPMLKSTWVAQFSRLLWKSTSLPDSLSKLAPTHMPLGADRNIQHLPVTYSGFPLQLVMVVIEKKD
jgi:hypothetical protein